MTAILIKASKAIQMVNPAARIFPSSSGAFTAIVNPRQNSRVYKITSTAEPTKPVSSPTTAKMLSVDGKGNPVSFVSDLPMPNSQETSPSERFHRPLYVIRGVTRVAPARLIIDKSLAPGRADIDHQESDQNGNDA